MLTIVTGPFHPDLEAALVSQVRLLKQGRKRGQEEKKGTGYFVWGMRRG